MVFDKNKKLICLCFIKWISLFILINKMARVIKNYHDNKQLKEEYFVNNRKIEGEYKEYYENGQLREICNYVNGKIEGEYKIYNENGQLDKIFYYVNDIKQYKN